MGTQKQWNSPINNSYCCWSTLERESILLATNVPITTKWFSAKPPSSLLSSSWGSAEPQKMKFGIYFFCNRKLSLLPAVIVVNEKKKIKKYLPANLLQCVRMYRDSNIVSKIIIINTLYLTKNQLLSSNVVKYHYLWFDTLTRLIELISMWLNDVNVTKPKLGQIHDWQFYFIFTCYAINNCVSFYLYITFLKWLEYKKKLSDINVLSYSNTNRCLFTQNRKLIPEIHKQRKLVYMISNWNITFIPVIFFNLILY